MRSRILAAMITVSGALLPVEAAQATEVYRSIDKDGQVIYSDRPGNGAEPVKVKPVNTLPELQKPPSPEATQESAGPGEASIVYTKVAITSPQQGAIITNAGGSFLVSLVLEPQLRAGDTALLLLDGQPAGAPGDGGITVVGVSRGEHALQLQVTDAAGKVVASSEVVLITMYRPPTGTIKAGARPTPR
jgi:hypothetical protein